MKIPKFVLCSLLMVPVAMAEPDPQQQGKTFGDGHGLPRYLAHYDVQGGPNGTGDGMLDQEECQAMEQARDQIRKQLRQGWDTDGDGRICAQEREQAQVQLRQMIEERRLVRFEEADADEDGELSRAEFETLPGIVNKLATDPDLVDAIFARLDADTDGAISLEEFLAVVRQCDQNRDGSGDGHHRGGEGGGMGGGGGGMGGGGGGGMGGS